MKRISREKLICPGCQSRDLKAKSLECGACGTQVTANIRENEFASLSTEELHFLRVFVHCEGKIKDMEKALGISYPSVKAEFRSLKERLAKRAKEIEVPKNSDSVLRDLEAGNLTYEQALNQIRKISKK